MLVVWITGVVLATAFAAGWPTDNRVARWVTQLGEGEDYRILVDRFGGDEFVLVRVQGADPGQASDRAQLADLWSELAAMPAVSRVVDALALPGVDPAGLADDPVVAALDLVDRDGARYDFVLALASAATPSERAALAVRLRESRATWSARGWSLRAAGHPLVAAALDDEARAVERTFAPALGIIAAIAVACFLRSIGLAIVVILPAALASAAPRAALRLLGIDSDLILVVLGPLGFVIVLASTLHVATAYQRLRRTLPAPAARRAAVREKLPAGMLAAATTAVGFGAFLTSGLRSVATLGVAAAITVLTVVPLAFALATPLFGPWERGGDAPRAGRSSRASRRWRDVAGRALRARFAVLATMAGTMALGAFAAVTLPSSTNALHYFPADHPSRADFVAFEQAGSGLSTAEVLARFRDGRSWPIADLAAGRLSRELEGVAGVQGVLGPEDIAPLGDRLPLLGPASAMRLAGRIDPGADWARWTVRFPTLDAAPTRAIVDSVRATADRWVGTRDIEVLVTGSVPAMLAMQDVLIATLASSLALTAAATTICFLWVSRRPRDLLAALLTNVFPVACALGAARLLGIPLDGATVMVAAVVLGLAVDNTFHLLHAGRGGGARARLRAFDRVGQAAFASSAALALGFAALALSAFAPTARFGLLCAIGMVAALVSDLVVLPALWVRPTRAGGASGESCIAPPGPDEPTG